MLRLDYFFSDLVSLEGRGWFWNCGVIVLETLVNGSWIECRYKEDYKVSGSGEYLALNAKQLRWVAIAFAE